MPIFERQKIIFIHIPKTGGTSLENYFRKKFGNMKLVDTSGNHDFEYNGLMRNFGNSPQHLIYGNFLELNIEDLKDYTIISVVRNPYHRIISDLLFLKIATFQNSKDFFEEKIEEYLSSDNNHDNHKTPQYKFLVSSEEDEDIKLVNCILLRTENLSDQMRNLSIGNLSFSDFNNHNNLNTKNSDNYMKYLTENSIRRINEFYRKDFEIFGYEIIEV